MKKQTRRTERLTNLAYAHKSAGTLIVAIEAGLLTAISEWPWSEPILLDSKFIDLTSCAATSLGTERD